MKSIPAFFFVFFLAMGVTAQTISYDVLDINRVKARINSNGSHFWDQQGIAKYEVPKGSGINAIFAFNTWCGGRDVDGQLHLAGGRYNTAGQDYWPGPVSDTNSYTAGFDTLWDKVWKINKTEIDYHKNHYWVAGYTAPPAILSWPGNGNPALGQAARLAPFYDLDADDMYEPMDGDYPMIRGDQSVFFIMNDNRSLHSETGGKAMRLEIHGMAYAFDCPEDSTLQYTTFLHYDIYNRSAAVYHDTYLAAFLDTDLGSAWDDYIGCDVGRGSFFTYNGDNIDGNYGAFPPALATTVLGGPYLDPDNLDNPKFDNQGNPLCDLSINGLDFGDGIVDNERYGMSKFVYTTNCASGPTCDPAVAADYYKIMHGMWKDSVVMQYGGNGHPNAGATGGNCSFMFPDLSDNCNWGTNGIQPPGYLTGAGGSGASWTEANAANPPNDRRGTLSMGPFTFLAGDHQEMDLAFVWARQYTDSSALAAVDLLKTRIDKLRTYFRMDSIPCGGSFSGIVSPSQDLSTLEVFPNPASTVLNLKYNNRSGAATYQLINVLGERVGQGKLRNMEINQIPLSGIIPGMYFLVVYDGNVVKTKRFLRK